MTTCVEVYIEDDGTMSVAVEQDVQPEPEEGQEQKQPVESLEQVMQILQAVVTQSQGGQEQPAVAAQAEEQDGMNAGFAGVRGGGL